jgi:hypothetical protein
MEKHKKLLQRVEDEQKPTHAVLLPYQGNRHVRLKRVYERELT